MPEICKYYLVYVCGDMRATQTAWGEVQVQVRYPSFRVFFCGTCKGEPEHAKTNTARGLGMHKMSSLQLRTADQMPHL